MNVDNSHWICITADDYNRNSVNIFDSRKTGTVSTQTKEVIANLLQCEVVQFTSLIHLFSSKGMEQVVDFLLWLLPTRYVMGIRGHL